mmetsp:Transcript_27076/g.72411  ORF Transcript_27076/g.72411 Transcript_27076/m.72411 type:complete len:421 (+) Transcript_27076:2-1264(+)
MMRRREEQGGVSGPPISTRSSLTASLLSTCAAAQEQGGGWLAAQRRSEGVDQRRLRHGHVHDGRYHRHVGGPAAEEQPHAVRAPVLVDAGHRDLDQVHLLGDEDRQVEAGSGHPVQVLVGGAHQRHVEDGVDARVLRPHHDLELRAHARDLRVEPHLVPAAGGHRPVARAQQVDVRARGGEPQLAQVALEGAVHVHGLLALPGGLLHVQPGLLGHVQRDVLLGRRPGGGPARLEVGAARQDLDHERPALEAEDHGALLAPKGAQPHPRHHVVRLRGGDELLAVVQPDLAVVQCHGHHLGGPHLRDGEEAHARDGSGEVDAVALLALEVEAVDHVVHATDVDALVVTDKTHRLRLELDHVAQHRAILDGVNVAIAASDRDPVLHVVQPEHGHEGGDRVELHLRQYVQSAAVQDVDHPVLRA